MIALCIRSAAAIIFVMALAPCVRAEAAPQVEEFLSTLNASLVAVAHRSESGMVGGCARIMTSAVNIDAVARAAAADAWSRMSPGERTAYRAVVEQRAVRECVRQEHHSVAPLKLVGARQSKNGDWLLATRPSQGEAHNLIWRLRDDGQHLRAVDILFDGRSTVFTFRQETKNLLDSNGGNIGMMINAFNR